MLISRTSAASVVLMLIAFGQVLVAQPFESCGRLFTCEVGNDGDGVDVAGGGWEPLPAEPAEPADPLPGEETGGEYGPDPVAPVPGPGDVCWDDLRPLMCPAPTTPEPTPDAPGYPDTIYNTDLVRFTPHAPRAETANEGMTLVTSPASVSVAADSHSLVGTLLGYPVTVTFAPVRVGIDFGDGSSASHRDWSAVFEHLYSARGLYTTTLTAEYAATVTFADGTPRPVAGTITATVAGPGIRVLAARTGLVTDACTATPHAFGC